ncbi:MAG: Adenosylmethionine-8-amino-7-oxononanoate aminotransferase [uncultured Solirubrobacteraceae bacterium]|uniref:Adenosylmethionine-8-amino-7-oxononanoate aminotransferase n=1 Tax=uncultured Solirubrobacteraceae bacterium TaxID=1162706 RepID=A0A6J4SWR5_9ACTN|nr:MAG: Adenosylmethionine-8-amino-7-oxononanoate aminotransferase [uncultured Solirubrobacteraceae bacterium]
MPSDHTERLRALDRDVLWHPFTQQQGWQEEDAPIIERAHGVTVVDTDGNEYLDGTSALWCNVHGHAHPAIDAAVHAQLEKVAHTTMLGLSHPAAIELGARLVELAPGPLSRVFYSDNGSTSVEVALKMAYQWWAQRGEWWRSEYVCLRNSYHGDTLGSVSVGGIDLFHGQYRPLLFDSHQVEAGDLAAMEAMLSANADKVAAVIVEPLVQGAAGILVHPEGYLRAVRELCDRHGVFLICDEVATGFGRTGTMFACEQEGVAPDFLCLAKGLTGGYLPLAATLTTERVFEGFLGAFEELRTFFHGHTYTGNPLACAAAIATLDVFEDEGTLERLGPKIALLEQLLAERVATLSGVSEIRQRGFMVGIELVEHPLEARTGHQVTLAARRRGAIVRPLGDTVVLMPPLSISEAELTRLVEITAASIAEVTSGTNEAPPERGLATATS